MLEQLFGVPLTLASFLVALTVVVFVHEFGHFIIARRNGVRCDAFSIGFGPEIFGFTDKHGTRWKFSLIPLGGYVKMYGEGEAMQAIEGGVEEKRVMTDAEKAVSLKYKSVGQRAAIVFAGPAVNFLFAIAVFFVIYLVLGRPLVDPVVGDTAENSAAAAAGLQAGDRIAVIDGEKIARFDDIRRLVQLGYGAPMHMTVQRDGQELQIEITPRIIESEDAFGNKVKIPVLGIIASPDAVTIEQLGPVQALSGAVMQTYDATEGTFVAIGQMIVGRRGTEDLGGPIKIAQISGQAARRGPMEFVVLVAFLSINLGLINLFPVPLLDGGHLLFYAIEAIRGRPLSEQAQEWGMRVGLAIVGSLMLFTFGNDLVHVVGPFLSKLIGRVA